MYADCAAHQIDEVFDLCIFTLIHQIEVVNCEHAGALKPDIVGH
jgi:hypothetical protein